MEAVGADVEDFGAGGIRPAYFWDFLQGSGLINPPVWCRVMGDIPSDLEDPGQFSPQGGLPYKKYEAKQGRGG